MSHDQPHDRPADVPGAPPEPAVRPRRSDEVAPLAGLSRLAFRVSAGAFLLAIALMLLDAFAGVQLPQPWRGALPFVFAGGVVVSLTLYVSAYGAPKRPA